jgi:hypothetical protein
VGYARSLLRVFEPAAVHAQVASLAKDGGRTFYSSAVRLIGFGGVLEAFLWGGRAGQGEGDLLRLVGVPGSGRAGLTKRPEGLPQNQVE